MMEMFLNVVQAISDSRHWLLPLWVICVFVVTARIVFGIVRQEIEDIRD